jgi:uncharacterized protein with von Willebrand factor type A (vWA) domain
VALERPFVFRAVQHGQFGLVGFQPAGQGQKMAVKHGEVQAAHQRGRHREGIPLGRLSVDEVDANKGRENAHFGQSGCEWRPKWVRTTRDLDEVDATDVAGGANIFEALRPANLRRNGARLRVRKRAAREHERRSGLWTGQPQGRVPASGDSH